MARGIKQEEGEDNYDVFFDLPKRVKRTSRFSESHVEKDDDDVTNQFEIDDYGEDSGNSGNWTRYILQYLSEYLELSLDKLDFLAFVWGRIESWTFISKNQLK